MKKWEEREKRMAKQYAMDEEKELQRKRTILKEAKKLKAFLEDYDDERDDPKYYKYVGLNKSNGEKNTIRGLLGASTIC